MLIRKNIFKNFKWLKNKEMSFIISADYDGLICAAFLSHYLGWKLVGYYNMQKIWISQEGLDQKKNLIWVDLNIVPKAGKAIGGHITILDNQMPQGLATSCNPNLLRKITNHNFKDKYPFSTLSFLMWLYNIEFPKNDIGKFLILHSDATWLKYQKYKKNVSNWLDFLEIFNWELLFKDVDSIAYEKKIDQSYYPLLMNANAISGFSKLTSKHLKIKSRESKFNPDWDLDIVLNLFELFGKYLSWDPPELPKIVSKINGEKNKISINDVKKIGLKSFIKKNKIFSYAITSPAIFKYTVFDKIK